MRQGSLHHIQRFMILIGFLVLASISVIVARSLGYGLAAEDGIPAQRFVWAVFNQQIALISGHSGYDSGATCEDAEGNLLLKEADVVAEITQRVANRLTQAGADVQILQEFDPKLNDLQVDLLLSIHADSCIDATGFKAARGIFSQIPASDDQLIACIEQSYSAATHLATHPTSITHNMTEYHAWQRIAPTTAAAILEIGFLGGDQELLTQRPAVVAQGISDGILCFLTK